MAFVIGMDEAGYGPNLGPLVVTATVWEVPGRPRDFDFWTELHPVITQTAPKDDSQLQVADSKVVYNPSRGIQNLERSVLAAVRLLGHPLDSFQDLCQLLTDSCRSFSDSEPWFANEDLCLPQVADDSSLLHGAESWSRCCREKQVRLKSIQSDIVLTERFNRLTRQFDSKGAALSHISMRLLRRVWEPDETKPTLVVADKHGGRNRYDEFLDEILDGQMILRLDEGRHRSRYRIGATEVRFESKAESHFPVAVSSMVSKYVRELAMKLFNRFWNRHVPNLRPTKGYPADARRFKREIAAVQARLGISDAILWRTR